MIGEDYLLFINIIKLIEERIRREFYEIENLQTSHSSALQFVKTTLDFIDKKIFDYFVVEKPSANLIFKDGMVTRYNENRRYNIYIDTLCGLTNFIHAVPYFCTVITIKEIDKDTKKDKIIGGIINNYCTQETFYTEAGKGAFMNSKRMRVSSRQNFDNSIIAIKYDDAKTRYKNILDKVGTFKINNCSALDLCYVASGKYDGAFIYDRVPIDTDLGELFIAEAGGLIFENNNDLIVSNSLLHNNLIEMYK